MASLLTTLRLEAAHARRQASKANEELAFARATNTQLAEWLAEAKGGTATEWIWKAQAERKK